MTSRARFALIALVVVSSLGYHAPPPEDEDIRKIYLIDSVLLVSDGRTGVDFYDADNVASPRKIGGVAIDGNEDLAVYKGHLYLDSYSDLVVYSVSNYAAPRKTTTVRDVFQYYYDGGMALEGDGVYGLGCGCADEVSSDDAGTLEGGGGQGGSLARFTIVDDKLYCVDYTTLYVFDLANPAKPVMTATTEIDWAIETIYPYGDYLFIGGAQGMYVYEPTDSGAPKFVSEFRHARACDPVVVADSIAYVTLRSGTWCGPTNDELLILDVADPLNPTELARYPLSGPYGLAAAEGFAYVCDGGDGLKVIDATTPTDPKKHARTTACVPYDCILRGETLFATCEGELKIFEIGSRTSPRFLELGGATW
jgi:hypothetical protein